MGSANTKAWYARRWLVRGAAIAILADAIVLGKFDGLGRSTCCLFARASVGAISEKGVWTVSNQLRPESELVDLYAARTVKTGAWALTANDTVHMIGYTGGPLGPSQFAGLLSAAETWYTDVHVPGRADEGVLATIRHARSIGASHPGFGLLVLTTSTPIYWGHVHNAFPLACVAFIGVVAFLRARAAAREGVRFQRMERGCCAGCGYDLAGLGANPCPECGAGAAALTPHLLQSPSAP